MAEQAEELDQLIQFGFTGGARRTGKGPYPYPELQHGARRCEN